MEKEGYTKFEIARILGARALQLSMDAPLLIKIDEKELEKLGYDPLKIAEKEFNEEILPITVKRVLPEMAKKKLKVERRTEEKDEDKKKEEVEKTEEKEIKEEGEIMELVKPEDEIEQEETGGEEAEE